MLSTTFDILNEEASSTAPSRARGKNCESNGVVLRHRTLKYYGENSYVACSNGVVGCYLIERVHDKATEVACPTTDLQQRIDRETNYRELEKRFKKEAQRDDDNDSNRKLSLVVVSTTRIWDGGVVCYQLSKEFPFNKTHEDYIYKAMNRYEESTNVRFVNTAKCKKEKLSHCDSCVNYVDFKHPTVGRDCNSSIGITDDGPQIMNLADRCFEVDDDLKTVYGSAMHEIGHSLGLYHEHQHPKRSIGVLWDSIEQSLWSEMSIRELSVGGPYDVESVMHYPRSYGFCQPNICSKSVEKNCVKEGTIFCNLNDDDNCIEITEAMCNETATNAIGQRKYLSKGDLAAINELYHSAAWPLSKSKIRD